MAKKNFFSRFFPTQKRKYDGAAKTKRTSRWFAPSTSANAEVMLSLPTLRDRSRDLRRNNPYAARAVQGISNNVVGAGIETQFRLDGEDSPEKSPATQLWDSWAGTTAIDYDGVHDIYGMQRLVMDAVIESGEVLIRKRYRAGLAFPLQYQILESDFLDINRNYPVGTDGLYTIQGIQYNQQGERVAYWLFETHPGGYNFQQYPKSFISSLIPADEIDHVLRVDRPGQVRGVPWAAPIIIRLKDLDDLEDAQLMRQKIAACFTAFVRDIDGLGAIEISEDQDQSELASRLEPGLIEHLPNGKSIEFTSPPTVENYKEYTSTLLHAIAVGYGVTYELLTSDLSQVNYSSARMGWLEFSRNIKSWQSQIIISRMLNPIVEDFRQTAALLGKNLDKYSVIQVPPRREMIDPTKEIPAAITAIRGGLMTLTEYLLADGKDPAEHFAQFAKDLAQMDKLNLTFDSDPRKPANGAAAPQPSEGSNVEKNPPQ